jgi:putative cell wall-binding protein
MTLEVPSSAVIPEAPAMPRRPRVRPAAAVRRALVPALAALLVLGGVLPASSQVPAVPGLPDVPDVVQDVVDDLDAITGIPVADPVLDAVTDTVADLVDQVDDALLDVPLVGDLPVVNTVALGGEDVIDAAVAWSQATFPEGAGTAILSRGDLFADAFASGAFQGAADAPLLFTDGDDLDVRTAMELQRLGMDAITILGGEDALHPVVVNKLELAGLAVTRVGGATRVETSVAAAQATHPDADHVVLVRAYPDAGQPDGQAYADLLAAGPFAAENGWPILMTTSDALHPAVAAHLEDADVEDVTIVGGPAAVSEGVEASLAALGVDVDRVAGTNRFATAVELAEARGFASAADADRLVIAESGGRADVWGPGFAATAHSARNDAPVLLTAGPEIPAETLAFLTGDLPANLQDGGPAVVCASFVDPVACAAVGALMLLDLAAVEDLLGALPDLPDLGELVLDLDLEGLLDGGLGTLIDLLEELGVDPDVLTDLLEQLLTADPEDVVAILTGLLDGLGLSTDDLEDLVDGGTTVEDVVDGLDDLPADGVDGVIDDVVDGLPTPGGGEPTDEPTGLPTDLPTDLPTELPTDVVPDLPGVPTIPGLPTVGGLGT